mmetsp:Transcript_93756/g.264730  ORF Transcript_93756/g.264730 Transcript_93756/m.264730 type:complete len:426 (-) Transcript_93756:61-1338(-)
MRRCALEACAALLVITGGACADASRPRDLLGFIGVLVAFSHPQGARARGQRRPRFLFISSPSTHNVYYALLPSFHFFTLPPGERPDPPRARVLIDGGASRCRGSSCSESSDKGLRSPQGLALHQGPDGVVLYVSDVEAGNIYAYEIAGGGDERALTEAASAPKGSTDGGPGAGLQVGAQRLVCDGIDGGAQWLTVDGQGNLFYTAQDGSVGMIKASDISSGNGDPSTPVTLFASANSETVSSPAGVATDGLHLYWANQRGGGSAGTLVKALEQPDLQQQPRVIAANGAGAVGVCIARDTIFYTSDSQSLFAVKAAGGAIAEVSRSFHEPRGCAYDGENTLFVVDSAEDMVFSLPVVSRLRAVRHSVSVASVVSPSEVVVFSATGGKLKGPPLAVHSRSVRPAAPSVAAILAGVLSLIWVPFEVLF